MTRSEDELAGRAVMRLIDGSGREIIQRQGRTILDRPGGSGLRKETAV